MLAQLASRLKIALIVLVLIAFSSVNIYQTICEVRS